MSVPGATTVQEKALEPRRNSMKNRFKTIVALGAAVAAGAVLTSGPAAAVASNTKTMANLQAAYNGESNAKAKYLLSAKKADAEGFGAAASLFRAAARAEEVHAANHARVIRKLGGEPVAKIETPAFASTKDAIESAVKGETYERDTMYPDFIAVARAEGEKDAIETFSLAKTAEAEHAKLYQAALGELTAGKSAAKKLYVCTVCGLTTTNLDFAKCRSCFQPKDKYVEVS
jgi:rubrerythrin